MRGPVNLPTRAKVVEYILDDFNMPVNGVQTRDSAPPSIVRAPDIYPFARRSRFFVYIRRYGIPSRMNAVYIPYGS